MAVLGGILKCVISSPHSASIVGVGASGSSSKFSHVDVVQFVAYYSSRKKKLDYSRVPTLNEEDLEESFIRGSGPGGSNVNKLANCVHLIHKPTGIVHKCHKSRLLQENRKLARQQLIEKLDEHFNGEMSIKSQKERMETKKSVENDRRFRNRLELKQKYLEHIENDTADNVK